MAHKTCNLKQIIVTDKLNKNDRLLKLICRTLKANDIEFNIENNETMIRQSGAGLVDYDESGDDEEKEETTSKSSVRQLIVQDLEWGDYSVLLLLLKDQVLPKLDIIIGSDVFFEGKCK